ncbi:FTR1 family iron permease [Alicyclobacillus mengziensis]|uniref:FTR1 family protein n=1 Tax=Alicyclobacillus mengziensis TaxID=2931921 RepID=A0A9X7VVS3_9BACL|nr:FTR1 family protein [Alicyclobacillus mengziensis]QSO45847.1 FTR1 family protein [Alicyclobacillus mengziensis]
MLASFLIFFRESLEASMICSIMLAYLKQIGRRDRFKDVWIGIWSAVAVAVIGGVVVFSTLRNYDGSDLQTKIEGTTYFIACGVLTYMTFWMKKQGKNLKNELHAKMNAAISTGSIFAIALIAFITVGREGLETVVFMIAIAFHTNPSMLAMGAAVGVLAGLILSYVIYVLGKRINLKHFFDVMGTLLMLFAAGLLADGIEDFQQLGWLPGEHALWNTTSILSEDSTFGDILHSFFGYADNPTALQVIFYVCFIAIVVWLFWRNSTNKFNSQQTLGD